MFHRDALGDYYDVAGADGGGNDVDIEDILILVCADDVFHFFIFFL